MTYLALNWGLSTAAAVLAGAISMGGGAAFAETTLQVWAWDQNFNGDVMQRAMRRYAETHPDMSVEVSDFGNDAQVQKLQSQLASGSTEGLPDIVLLEDYYAQRFLLSFPDAFVPIGDHIDLSGMAAYKTAVSTVGDTIYSMPFDSGVSGLFYRRADLEAAGFTADDLQNITWDRLIEIGKAVEEKTGKKLIAQDFSKPDLARLMLQSAGTWYVTPEGEVTAESDPRFAQVAQAYVDVLASGIVQDVSGWENYIRAFTAHEVSGVMTGAWIIAAIKTDPEQSGDWALAPIPRIDGIEGAANVSNVGGSSWYLLNSAPNKDVALDFFNEIWAKDVGFYEEILADKGAIGSLLDARNSTAYEQPDDFFGGQKVWAELGSWLTDVPGINYGVFTAEGEAAFVNYFPEVARGNMSFDDALSQYTARLKSQIQ